MTTNAFCARARRPPKAGDFCPVIRSDKLLMIAKADVSSLARAFLSASAMSRRLCASVLTLHLCLISITSLYLPSQTASLPIRQRHAGAHMCQVSRPRGWMNYRDLNSRAPSEIVVIHSKQRYDVEAAKLHDCWQQSFLTMGVAPTLVPAFTEALNRDPLPPAGAHKYDTLECNRKWRRAVWLIMPKGGSEFKLLKTCDAECTEMCFCIWESMCYFNLCCHLFICLIFTCAFMPAK